MIAHEPPNHRIEPISHLGENMFFTLEGEITAEIQNAPTALRQDRTIDFDTAKVHSTWNHSSESASIIWCGTMDAFGEAPPPIHKKHHHQYIK